MYASDVLHSVVTDKQTDKQTDYCNPRCACAQRLNYYNIALITTSVFIITMIACCSCSCVLCRKKKKKNKAKEVVEKLEEKAADVSATEASAVRTKAEMAFEKVQEKRVNHF